MSPITGLLPGRPAESLRPRLRRDRHDPAGRTSQIHRNPRTTPALQIGEEVLAQEALVGAQKQPDTVGQPAQALVQEASRAGRGGGVAVAELRVQPFARLADEAEQRVPADLALVGATRPLPGTD